MEPNYELILTEAELHELHDILEDETDGEDLTDTVAQSLVDKVTALVNSIGQEAHTSEADEIDSEEQDA